MSIIERQEVLVARISVFGADFIQIGKDFLFQIEVFHCHFYHQVAIAEVTHVSGNFNAAQGILLIFGGKLPFSTPRFSDDSMDDRALVKFSLLLEEPSTSYPDCAHT